MSQFSTKERLIASLLSSFPLLKKQIKNLYIRINAVVYKKTYSHKILDSRITDIFTPFGDSESFGGYYDKFTINSKGVIAGLLSQLSTSKKPKPNLPVTLALYKFNNQPSKILDISSYNWQQGARVQWINDDTLMFNIFKNEGYKTVIFSISSKNIIREFDYPVQDAYKDKFFLSINYRRIMAMRPDYGYRNLSKLSKSELKEIDSDGIWLINQSTGESELLLSLADVTKVEPKELFNSTLHNVNHIMIKPNGKGFIFIHRWYKGKRRFDRLMYYDFNNLKVLADDNMVSHMCWIDDNTVFGYLRHNGKNGFYFIDIISGEFTPCNTLSDLGSGDGHPTTHGNWICIDTYPDKSRMQSIYLYNRESDKVIKLLEVFQPVKYSGECRCDLHPRFSPDGNKIFFDSVYTGKRQLCWIDVSKIIHN